jgi:site-specific DNA recombinase
MRAGSAFSPGGALGGEISPRNAFSSLFGYANTDVIPARDHRATPAFLSPWSPPLMRVAIYARYSSEQQSEHSIDDQVRLCRVRAEREGWTVGEVYADYALSGATTNRPRLQQLVADARRGQFDVVLAEALDRISRDQEHIAGIWKGLTFAAARLVTISEGEINELHVGLKGTMNALFLKDLAAKTHRGLTGRVEAGKSGGGLCYGYDVVKSVDARGEPVRGDRCINQAQAAIVRRIFAAFADGASPIGIAKQLNAEGLTGPQGHAWRDTTIRGHAQRGTGLLRNRLYAGELVWNRMRFIRDPQSGKRVSRPNPEAQWVVTDKPELRIVEPALWDRVQHRLGDIRQASGANEPERDRFWERRRAVHLLTQKVHCGVCGGMMSNVGRDYVACQTARKQGTCSNTRGIRRPDLDSLILDALRTQLMDPALFAAFSEAFVGEWNRAAGVQSSGRDQATRELTKVERKLKGLIEAISDGFRAAGLQEQVATLEAQRIALTARLAETAVQEVPRLHPELPQAYRRQIERLGEALETGPDNIAALEAVRGLIERIILYPVPERGFEIEVLGDIAAMIRLGQAGQAGQTGTRNGGQTLKGSPAVSDLFVCSVKVVAGTGFEPVTFRL